MEQENTKDRGSRNRPTKEEFDTRLHGRSNDEVMATVMRYFCLGNSASDVRRAVNAELGTKLRREDPLKFLRDAALSNRLRYVAPQEAEWGQRIQEAYELKSVRVVRTSQSCDVASCGAQVLLSLIEKRTSQKLREGRRHQKTSTEETREAEGETIRIGFGGGYTLFSLASHLSQNLAELPHSKLPSKISMHAMVGSTWEATVTTPNYFFGKFIDAPDGDLDIRFVNLPAPPIVTSRTYRALVKEPVISEALEFKDQLDIVCTSAGNWADPHAHFPQLLKRWLPDSADKLGQADGVGDLLWLPLEKPGRGQRRGNMPSRDYRPMTLLSHLDELSQLISAGRDCLVVLSSCRKCGKPKSGVLAALLNAGLVTHLVVDSKTAEPLLEQLP